MWLSLQLRVYLVLWLDNICAVMQLSVSYVLSDQSGSSGTDRLPFPLVRTLQSPTHPTMQVRLEWACRTGTVACRFRKSQIYCNVLRFLCRQPRRSFGRRSLLPIAGLLLGKLIDNCLGFVVPSTSSAGAPVLFATSRINFRPLPARSSSWLSQPTDTSYGQRA